MNKIKQALKKLWQDESGQGATEYILILVVVGVLIVAFKDKIVGIIEKRTEDVGGKLSGAINDASTR